MIKNIAILICLLAGCKENTHNYYSGIIHDESGLPVENAEVKEYIDSYDYPKSQVTDRNGYFRFDRSEGLLPDIIISKPGFISDTISMFFSQHGETIEYSSMITKDSTVFVLRWVK